MAVIKHFVRGLAYLASLVKWMLQDRRIARSSRPWETVWYSDNE